MEGSQPLSEFDLSEAEKSHYHVRANRRLIELVGARIYDRTKGIWSEEKA